MDSSEAYRIINQPCGSCDQPYGSCDQPCGSCNQPFASCYQPCGSCNQPCGSCDQSCGSCNQPCGSCDQPCGSACDDQQQQEEAPKSFLLLLLLHVVATRDSWIIALILCLLNPGANLSAKVQAASNRISCNNHVDLSSATTNLPLIQKGRSLLQQQLQETNISTFSLVAVDRALQEAAFSAIVAQDQKRHNILKEYEPHNVTIPANLSGIATVQAVRLVQNSFLLRGIKQFNEFHVPNRTRIQASRVRRLIIVYTNFGNFSSVLYRLPSPSTGLEFLTPVLAMAVYDASDLTSTNPFQYSVNTSTANPDNLTVTFSSLISSNFNVVSSGLSPPPLCAAFSLVTGNVTNTGNLISGNRTFGPYVCSFSHLGAFALIGQALSQSPSPAPSSSASVSPPPAPGSHPAPSNPRTSSSSTSSNAQNVALGTVFGVVGGLAILALLGTLGYRFRQKRRIDLMHMNSDRGETLEQSSVGHNRVPVAGSTRTRPSLESLHDTEDT